MNENMNRITVEQAVLIVDAIQSGEVDGYDLTCLINDPKGWIADSSSSVACALRNPTMVEPYDCERCGDAYDEANGDGYCGLCPACADATEEEQS